MALWGVIVMCIAKRRQITTTTDKTAKIPTTFCSTIKTGSTHCEMGTGVEVFYLPLPRWAWIEMTALSCLKSDVQQAGSSATVSDVPIEN